MEKTFLVKIAEEVPAPEEYIKNMLGCIDENGNLNIARSISENSFCTSDGEDYTHIESVKLDKSRACFDELTDFYRNAITAVEHGTLAYERLRQKDRYAYRTRRAGVDYKMGKMYVCGQYRSL